jgi:DNA-directed RNA polymerase sigma subunit (sigma70/sigma32)
MSTFPPFLRNGVPFEELTDGWDLHEAVCERLEARSVRRHVAELPDLERSVIARRFGLLGPPATRAEIAEALQMRPATIGRIERRAMRHLRGTYALSELREDP